MTLHRSRATRAASAVAGAGSRCFGLGSRKPASMYAEYAQAVAGQ